MEEFFFMGARLIDLPERDALRVSINATNLWTGKRFRFSRDSVGDYFSGYCYDGIENIKISTAVAASAAFPPAFTPLVLKVEGNFWKWPFAKDAEPVLVDAAQVRNIVLTDGGVYDNIGLQAARQRCGTIIAVDAGLPLDLSSQTFSYVNAQLRAVDVMMSQITSQCVKSFVSDLLAKSVKGCLVRISQTVKHICTVPVEGLASLSEHETTGLDGETVALLSGLRTDLDGFTDLECQLLRYHGQTTIDSSVRRFLPELANAVPPQLSGPVKLEESQRLELKAGARRKYSKLFSLMSPTTVRT
jgi:NTE family protein